MPGYENLFVADGIEVGAAKFASFRITNGATVTLTDWVLTCEGTIGTAVNGTLVLNNCRITGSKAGSPLFAVNGENTTLVVNGGVYDLAGLEDTSAFQLGVEGVTHANSTAIFKGVTIWASTSTSKAGILAYDISELTVEDCLITPYKGIVKGDIHTMPESFTVYVSTIGIRTHAAVTTIKGTEIHGGGSAGAIYVYAGEATITDVITYCFRGVAVRAGAVANIYSSTFTSSPFNSNFYGLEADGGTINVYSAAFLNRMDIPGGAKHNNYASMCVTNAAGVINIFGGSYECAAINGDGATNQSALIMISKAGGKVNVFKNVTLTFSGHGGYVFELVEGAILEMTGATVNVTGTDAVIVTGAGTATFTDCVFSVTNAQTDVLFAAGEFKGNSVVLAPDGTKVTVGVVLDAYTQSVRYAGMIGKIWVISAGAFENDALAGAGVYVDTANVETSGIRFATKISYATLRSLIRAHDGVTLDSMTFYTLVAPMDYIAAAGGVFTKEALDALDIVGAKYVAIQARKSLLQNEDGSISYAGTLIGLQSYTRLYAAIPVIELDMGDEIITVYGEFNSADNVRSARRVAKAIIDDMESEYYTEWTNEQVAIVDKYAGINLPPDTTDFTFTRSDSTVTITGYVGESLNVVIPTQVVKNGIYYSVTAIGAEAFCNRRDLTSVTIPEGVTVIGERAFFGCEGLTSIAIPEGVTSLGEGAFAYCAALASIEIPASVTSIGNGVLVGCTNLTSIVVEGANTVYHSSGNTIIETVTNTLVQGCSNSTIPDYVTAIGDYAFYECKGLSALLIPVSVKSVGYSAFYSCTDLTSVYYMGTVSEWNNVSVKDDNTSLDNAAVYYYLTETPTAPGNYWHYVNGTPTIWVVPDTTDFAFTTSGETATITGYKGILASVNIPEYVVKDTQFYLVTAIGEKAFYDCDGLVSIMIPANVTSIGECAFLGCDNLSVITVAAENPVYHSVNHCLIETQTGILMQGCDNSVIPDYVTVIGKYAFANRTSLTTVVIPAGVTRIDDFAFDGCDNLALVTFAENSQLTSIGGCAFSGCAFASITLPERLTTIEANAFEWCAKLTSIVIPASVTRIEMEAFYPCDSLATVYYCGTASEWSGIYIGSDNYELNAATFYYYSAVRPTDDGNYWYYNQNGEIVVWEIVDNGKVDCHEDVFAPELDEDIEF